MPDFGFEFEFIPELSDFPAEERTPAVVLLLGICRRQREQLVLQHKRIELLQAQILEQSELIANQSEQIALQAEEIQRLKDEIARLKGEKGRPMIKPSTLNKASKDKGADDEGKKRNRGKPSTKKTGTLEIHEEKIIEPADIPAGSRFKGYEDYTVQDIEIRLKNTGNAMAGTLEHPRNHHRPAPLNRDRGSIDGGTHQCWTVLSLGHC